MSTVKIIFIVLTLALAGYWLYDFITTGTPSVLLAMSTMVMGIFGAVILPRIAKSSRKSPE